MRQSEVAAGGYLSFFKVNAVDGKEVSVQVVEVIQDPENLAQPVRQRGQPRLATDRFTEAGQPRRAFPPPSSCLPRASLTMMSTILSICSAVSPFDSSSAM